MKFINKVIVAVNQDPNLMAILRPLGRMQDLRNTELHLVHVFPTVTYPMLLSSTALTYPLADERQTLEQEVLSQLARATDGLFAPDSGVKVVFKCLFSEEPKRKFCEYAQQEKADTLIVLAREKHGLFDSSFAQYVMKHSTANLVVIKHKV